MRTYPKTKKDDSSQSENSKADNKNFWTSRTIAEIVVGIILAIVSGFVTYFVTIAVSNTSLENDFNYQFAKTVRNGLLSSSLLFTGAEKIGNGERIIGDTSEIRFKLFIKLLDGDWIEIGQEPFQLDDRGFRHLQNLQDGEYKIELDFHGITLAREENVFISSNKGQFTKLLAMGTPGLVRVRVLDSMHTPLPYVFVTLGTISTLHAFHEDSTDQSGYTKPRWVSPVIVDTNDYYFINVFALQDKKNKLGGRSRIRPVFQKTGEVITYDVVIHQEESN